MRILVTLPLFALSLSCVNLPSEDEVRDMRVLAVKIDPPELLYSFAHLFPAEQRAGIPVGPYAFTVKTLVVDPTGNVVELTNRLCPEERDDPCPGYHIRDDAPAEEIRDMVPLVTPQKREGTANLGVAGEVEFEGVQFSISDRAMDYMLPRDAEGNLSFTGLLFPTFPSVVVRAYVPGTDIEEVAFKRFSLAMDLNAEGLGPDVQGALEDIFVGALGFQFCTPEEELSTENVQCIKKRVANRNPTIVRMLYTRDQGGGGGPGGGGDGDGFGPRMPRDAGPPDPTDKGRYEDVTGRIQIEQGQSVTFRPVFADDDHEPYQQFVFDGDTGEARIENYKEDIACIWYATHGNTDGVSGEGGFGAGGGDGFVDGEVSAHADAPEGPAAVWAICVDQRGGLDWRRIDVEITSSPGIGGGGGIFNF